MKTSYLDYAMSVIVARALPDARDGLKPVHRRILYSMHESGYESNKPHRKSARIVGEVMGKYHPHGDQAIYDSMVRMAQDFSLRLPLIDGQGNFGSMDGDRAAAMRYTEARLALAATAILEDIDRDTVDFRENYDGSEQEPEVLPSRIPNLLVNGAGGIAVGMATNIPPHNLGEVIDACCAYVDDPEIAIEELMVHVKAPDFPTGGIIMGQSGARSGFLTGRGSVIMRGRVHTEDRGRDLESIVITEIPYQTNKASMVEKMAEAVREKRIEGISEIRDESDRDGVRVVLDIKREAISEIVLNQLYRFTPLQTSFGVNMLALNRGRPQIFNLKEMIAAFVQFREEVITRRTKFELSKSRTRAWMLVGLAIAVGNIDEIVAIIRKAKDPANAREKLMSRAWPAADIEPLIELISEPGQAVVDGTYRLSEEQARAILDLRLHRLTALGREDIDGELKELAKKIEDYLDILRHRERLLKILRDELLEVKEKFATERRTEIVDMELDQDEEDLIQREEMVVTVTQAGYIKRVPLSTYRAQRRGGKGRTGMATRDEDFLYQVFVASTHAPILFFASNGKVYKLKVWKLPLGTPQARGKAMINLLPLEPGETINTVMPLPEDEDSWEGLSVMFATSKGTVRRNALSDFTHVMANGKLAMRLADEDKLIGVSTCEEKDDVLLAAHNGKGIRFPVTDVRVFKSRTSEGVRGIKLRDKDDVISMSILAHVDAETEERDNYLKFANAQRRMHAENGDADGDSEVPDVDLKDFEIDAERAEALASREEFILSVTENGYGKRTSAYEYRTARRGGQGIINIETSPRNGPVVASFPVSPDDQIMLVTDKGRLIRCPVNDIRIAGRSTQGVTLFHVKDDEHVVSVARLTESITNGEDSYDDDEPGDGEPDGEEIVAAGGNGADSDPESPPAES